MKRQYTNENWFQFPEVDKPNYQNNNTSTSTYSDKPSMSSYDSNGRASNSSYSNSNRSQSDYSRKPNYGNYRPFNPRYNKFNPNYRGRYHNNFRRNSNRSWDQNRNDGRIRSSSWTRNQSYGGYNQNSPNQNFQKPYNNNLNNKDNGEQKDRNLVQFTLGDVQYCKCNNLECKALHPIQVECPLNKTNKDQNPKNM